MDNYLKGIVVPPPDQDPHGEKQKVMTPEEINRQVAEKVMGWTKHDICKAWWFPNKTPLTLEDAILDFDPYHHIEHAWMVLKQISKLSIDRNKFDCDFKDELNYERWWMVDEERLCKAICLAALEAVKEGK